MDTNQKAGFSPDMEELERGRQVEALIAQLKAAGNTDAAKLVKQLHSSLEHTRYWYGTRHERLWHWAHEELTEQQRTRYFSIVANGTADMTEPPTYAQQFNQMRWRKEAAEKQRDELLIAAETFITAYRAGGPVLPGLLEKAITHVKGGSTT